MPYGESWRSRRRLFKKYFNMSNAAIYRIPEAKYLHRFLHQLLERPTELVNLLHQLVTFVNCPVWNSTRLIYYSMTGAISISMTYGIDISSENDPNFEIALLARQTIRECLTVGSALVDMFPTLKYLPTWFPGAKFHRTAAKSRVYAAKSRDCIFDNAYQKWVCSVWHFSYILILTTIISPSIAILILLLYHSVSRISLTKKAKNTCLYSRMSLETCIWVCLRLSTQ